MVRNSAVKDFFLEIKHSLSRFISVTLLLMLAVGFFSGLRVTQPDMRETADKYIDSHNMYDIRVQASLGLTDDDVAALSAIKGVSHAEGIRQLDALAAAPEQDIVIAMITLSGSGMDSPELLSGRMPEKADECVAEEPFLKKMGLNVGDTFKISTVADDFKDALLYREFTVVGIVRSPMYISNIQRGTSTLGSGSIAAYVMIRPDAVDLDYYTGIDILVDGAKEKMTYSDDYKNTVQPVMDEIKSIEDTRSAARYDKLVGDATDKLNDAKTELADKANELNDSKAKLEDARRQLEDGRAKLESAKIEAKGKLGDALNQLNTSQKQIDDGRAQLDASENALAGKRTSAEQQISSGLAELDAKKAQLDKAQTDYNGARTQLDAQLKAWNTLTPAEQAAQPETAAGLKAAESQLDAEKQELDSQQTAMDAAYAQANAQKTDTENQLSAAEAQIQAGYASLAESEKRLQEGKAEYEKQKASSDAQIASAENVLNSNADKIADGEKQVADGEAQLDDANNKIADNEKKISDISNNKWYVFDRNSNGGYEGYKQDADRMGALANIFPMIFFAVAALVCLTTMTRMVDEKRIELGTYKALGYSRLAASGKFLFYSFLATVLGTVGGIAVGTTFLPKFIFKAYSILYSLPPLSTPIRWDTVAISAAAALICTVGSTVFACISTLRETPASLLRPRAPSPGQRVLLEKITPIWRRMSFFAKVTARNIFRYKKRLIMTLIGIAGCTALIVTGFGLRDSILDITGKQFGEIFTYNLQVNLADGISNEQIDALGKSLSENKLVSHAAFVRLTSADLSSGGTTENGYVLVPQDPDKISDYIRLDHRKDGQPIKLTDDGAVITEKLSELLNLKVGDNLTINSDGIHTVRIADITENYVYHYVYMTPAYYQQVFGKSAAVNQAIVTCTDNSEQTSNDVSSAVLKLGGVSYVADYKQIARIYTDSMNSVNDVVLIILVSAALLAFIVLYNLANINITERTRELATIKVLGFYDGEVSWYIFRENTVLTLLSIAIGLVGGKFMHSWLVRTVEIDYTMFGRTAKPSNYIAAAVLTVIFAVVVNLIGHFRMKHINMVESLKTNE